MMMLKQQLNSVLIMITIETPYLNEASIKQHKFVDHIQQILSLLFGKKAGGFIHL